MNNKVFFLEKLQRVQEANASQFGEVIYLFNNKDRWFSVWDERYSEVLLNKFLEQSFCPNTDYFAISGYMIPLVIASNALTAEFGQIQVLYWNAPEGGYIPKMLGVPFEDEVVT